MTAVRDKQPLLKAIRRGDYGALLALADLYLEHGDEKLYRNIADLDKCAKQIAIDQDLSPTFGNALYHMGCNVKPVLWKINQHEKCWRRFGRYSYAAWIPPWVELLSRAALASYGVTRESPMFSKPIDPPSTI